jgi:4-aminobutyrate aminotransferase-like enzyme
MEEMIRTATSGRLAAFIAEPIQGVGGFITPPREYFSIVKVWSWFGNARPDSRRSRKHAG